jgi:hypothetical protein
MKMFNENGRQKSLMKKVHEKVQFESLVIKFDEKG